MEDQSLLVITPKPFEYESFRGFLLRVTEENGYLSPILITRLLGIEAGKPDLRKLSINKLAKILGCSEEKLEIYSHLSIETDMPYQWKILGHQLERAKHSESYLRNGAQFCPICANENGHIDAFWDLSIAIACPIHRTKPLDKCHICFKPISWLRPGLLKCKCGANYLDAKLENCEPAHAELMQIIHSKLRKKPIASSQNAQQFPLGHFEKLNFSQLLAIFCKAGQMSGAYKHHDCLKLDGKDNASFWTRAVNISLLMFSGWPNGYIDFLNRYFNDVDKFGRKYLQTTQLKKLIHEFSRKDFFDINSQFLINELLIFSSKEFQIPNPSNQKSKQLATQTAFKYTPYINGIMDASAEEKIFYADNKPLTPSEAADYIGLPCDILGLFWSTGLMRSYLISERAKQFKFPWYKEVLDEVLETIRQKNIPGFRRSSVRNERYITLEDVLNKASIEMETKLFILESFINGKLSIRGRFGRKLSSLILYKREIKQCVTQRREFYKKEGISLAEAATLLHTDKFGVEFLIKTGYLQYKEYDDVKKITLSFIKSFESQYISVDKVAENCGLSYSKILDIIIKLGLPTLSLPEVIEKRHSLFLPSTYEPKIRGCLSVEAL